MHSEYCIRNNMTRFTIHTLFRLFWMCLLNIWLSHTVVGSSIKKRVHWVCHPRSLSVPLPLSSHPPSYLSGHFGAYLFTGSSLIPPWQLFRRISSNPSDIGQHVFRLSMSVMNDSCENIARDPPPPLLWWWRGGACQSKADRGLVKPRAGFIALSERLKTNTGLPHNNSPVHTHISYTHNCEMCVYSFIAQLMTVVVF